MTNFFYSQLFVKIPFPTGSYAGKTIVITGSNIGLGKEAARHYVRLGVSPMILAEVDMASYASVKAFGARVNKDLDHNETMITVNVVSTFLLAALVMRKLTESAKLYSIRPVLCFTGSGAHTHTRISTASRPSRQEYPVYKLLPLLATLHFATLYLRDSYPVTLNTVSPGLCISGLARDSTNIIFLLQRKILARATEVRSRTLVHGGSAGPETHGAYLADCTIGEPSALCRGPAGAALAKRVWDELGAQLEAIQRGVMKNF
ncbi:putative short-chain dehydrogenase [Xylariaceae sp. FL0255]|nr:putative short-chain dehydrogenase [Xylariaceae sp. FL0255]